MNKAGLVLGLVLQAVEKIVELVRKRKEGKPVVRPPLKTSKIVDDYRDRTTKGDPNGIR